MANDYSELGLLQNPAKVSDFRKARELNHIVAESNDLIRLARYDLTPMQLKLVDYIVSKIKPEDTAFQEIEVPISFLLKLLDLNDGGSSYKRVWASLVGLRNSPITLLGKDKKGDPYLLATGWLANARLGKDKVVRLQIDNELAPYLLALKDSYVSYPLKDTIKLRGKYAIRLYKVMRMERGIQNSHKKGQGWTFVGDREGSGDPEWWRDQLGMPKSFSNSTITQNIKRAVTEISKKIDTMDLEYQAIKDGRNLARIAVKDYYLEPGRRIAHHRQGRKLN